MTSAIVVGGGMGGLAVASVALRHFDSVTIIDRDDLTSSRTANETADETKKRRAGVPQYNEPHIFAAGGCAALDALVPGFKAELRRQGAPEYDPGMGLYMHDCGRKYMRGVDTGITTISASRRLINETLQDMVVAAGGDRLALRDRTAVSGLLWGDDGGVEGVVLDGGEEVRADLVLWAGGRRTQTTLPKWLAERGVVVPPGVKVDWKVSYTARWMKLPEGYDPDSEFYIGVVHNVPTEKRHGMAMVVENGCAQFALLGSGGERAPLDHESWMAWAAALPDPCVYELAKRCEPVGPITRFAAAPNVRRPYHKVVLPEGLAVLGDAAVATNPVFAQGMSLSARGAQVLDSVLEGALRGKADAGARRAAARRVSPALQRRLHWATAPMFRVAANEDMRYPDTEVVGMWQPPAVVYRLHDMMMKACESDPVLYTAIMRVVMCVDDPLVTAVTCLPRGLRLAAVRAWRRWWTGGEEEGEGKKAGEEEAAAAPGTPSPEATPRAAATALSGELRNRTLAVAAA